MLGDTHMQVTALILPLMRQRHSPLCMVLLGLQKSLTPDLHLVKMTCRIRQDRSTLGPSPKDTRRRDSQDCVCSPSSISPLFLTPLSCHCHDVAPRCVPPAVGPSICAAEARTAAAGLQRSWLHDVQAERETM